MSDDELEKFFVRPRNKEPEQDKPTDQKKKKPRKRPTDARSETKENNENDECDQYEQNKKSAKFYCKTLQEWQSVCKYKPRRLESWIDEKRFESNKAVTSCVFQLLHKSLAAVVDRMMHGEGYVQREIENDLMLLEALQSEGEILIRILNNKLRIIALTAYDTINGKRKQRAELPEPRPEPHIEEVQEISETTRRETSTGLNSQ